MLTHDRWRALIVRHCRLELFSQPHVGPLVLVVHSVVGLQAQQAQ
jgi:hypothetical protein